MSPTSSVADARSSRRWLALGVIVAAGSAYGVVLLFNSGSPMMLAQTAIVHGVFNIIEGTAPPTSRPHLAAKLDTILAVLTLAALALGSGGVVRAGSWARRRHHAPLRAALSLLPPVLLLATGVVFPRLAEAWIGRDVTWRAAAYEWPAVVVFVGAALLAVAGTLLARSWRSWRVHRADPPSDGLSESAPTDRRAAIPVL